MKKTLKFLSRLTLAAIVAASACFPSSARFGAGTPERSVVIADAGPVAVADAETPAATADAETFPAWTPDAEKPYAVINGNIPAFTDADLTAGNFARYAPLDALGRCGTACANVSIETMPSAKRGAIGMARPSGWHTVRYDNLIEGRYLYNRCHLIAYRLAGENANPRNLITGTRYLNVEGMLPFEDMVGDYAQATGNHVLYRVTPIFEGDNLVASGVHMEARSVEDGGAGIRFNVYVYNIQPGVEIDYATGDSRAAHKDGGASAETDGRVCADASAVAPTYILNRNTKKFHYGDCGSVSAMSEKNKVPSNESRDAILSRGYSPCGKCKP